MKSTKHESLSLYLDIIIEAINRRTASLKTKKDRLAFLNEYTFDVNRMYFYFHHRFTSPRYDASYNMMTMTSEVIRWTIDQDRIGPCFICSLSSKDRLFQSVGPFKMTWSDFASKPEGTRRTYLQDGERYFIIWTSHDDSPADEIGNVENVVKYRFSNLDHYNVYYHRRDTQMYGHNHYHVMSNTAFLDESIWPTPLTMEDLKVSSQLGSAIICLARSLTNKKCVLPVYDILHPFKKFIRNLTYYGLTCMAITIWLYATLEIDTDILDRFNLKQIELSDVIMLVRIDALNWFRYSHDYLDRSILLSNELLIAWMLLRELERDELWEY